MNSPSLLLASVLCSCLCPPRLSWSQESGSPRSLSPVETGCVPPAEPGSRDSIYDAESVDRPVVAQRLPIEDMPFRMGEVLRGETVLRFVVEASGRVDPCSIVLVEENEPAWTTAVLKELRYARYRPGRRRGEPVYQVVYQRFRYHSDGRF